MPGLTKISGGNACSKLASGNFIARISKCTLRAAKKSTLATLKTTLNTTSKATPNTTSNNSVGNNILEKLNGFAIAPSHQLNATKDKHIKHILTILGGESGFIKESGKAEEPLEWNETFNESQHIDSLLILLNKKKTECTTSQFNQLVEELEALKNAQRVQSDSVSNKESPALSRKSSGHGSSGPSTLSQFSTQSVSTGNLSQESLGGSGSTNPFDEKEETESLITEKILNQNAGDQQKSSESVLDNTATA